MKKNGKAAKIPFPMHTEDGAMRKLWDFFTINLCLGEETLEHPRLDVALLSLHPDPLDLDKTTMIDVRVGSGGENEYVCVYSFLMDGSVVLTFEEDERAERYIVTRGAVEESIATSRSDPSRKWRFTTWQRGCASLMQTSLRVCKDITSWSQEIGSLFRSDDMRPSPQLRVSR